MHEICWPYIFQTYGTNKVVNLISGADKDQLSDLPCEVVGSTVRQVLLDMVVLYPIDI
jgi:hypothetical protein